MFINCVKIVFFFSKYIFCFWLSLLIVTNIFCSWNVIINIYAVYLKCIVFPRSSGVYLLTSTAHLLSIPSVCQPSWFCCRLLTLVKLLPSRTDCGQTYRVTGSECRRWLMAPLRGDCLAIWHSFLKTDWVLVCRACAAWAHGQHAQLSHAYHTGRSASPDLKTFIM